MKKSKGHFKHHARIVKVGGWAFILATIFYPILTLNSDLPPVLKGDMQDVVKNFFSSGGEGRIFLTFIAFVPMMLLLPAGLGVMEFLKRDQRILMELSFIFMALSSLSLSLGIFRWVAVNWHIGIYWEHSSGVDAYWAEVLYNYMNNYLGTFVGQFLAEIFLYTSILIISTVLMWSKRFPLWLGGFGTCVSLLGYIGTFRQLYPEASSFYDVVYWLRLVPLWMLALGVAMLRYDRESYNVKLSEYEKTKEMKARANKLENSGKVMKTSKKK